MAPTKNKQISAHSHIRGLGLDEEGEALDGVSAGLIGQKEARHAAGVVVELVRRKKLAGKAVLFVGPPGTGKTAIALAVSKELGTKVPFCSISGSEVTSVEVQKTEILKQNFRRAIGLRVRERKVVYEGEVTEVTPVETENPIGAVGKTIAHIIVGLKTAKGTKLLKLDPTIYDDIQREKIEVGDVIYIEANSGAVTRQGRCDAYAAEYDLEADEYVPLPKGDVKKTRVVVQDLTLHDLDAANSKTQGGNDILSMVSQLIKPRKTEITEKLRGEINKVVNKYIEDGVAELVPGVLFIDEVHMLDRNCFAFLNKALENKISPIVILATNRAYAPIRGDPDNTISNHGLPNDLLDRLLFIPFPPYKKEELAQIIRIKTEASEISLDDTCLDYAAQLASETSLRYVIQLMEFAKTLSKNAKTPITVEIIKESKELFLDWRTVKKLMAEENDGGDVVME